MRLTERELTVALEGAAKSVLAAQDKDVRKGRRTADDAWAALTKYQRYQMLAGLGDQLLGVLVALPDVDVRGRDPADVHRRRRSSRRSRSGRGDEAARPAGKVLLKARVALVQLALSHIPPRADPDALVVPDHL